MKRHATRPAAQRGARRARGPGVIAANRVRAARTERGLSQAALAEVAGLTRQAIYSIESNRYPPNVTIALRLARALDKRVEELFELEGRGSTVEGELLGRGPSRLAGARVKVWSVGRRTLVLPVADLGPALNYTVPADGLIVDPAGPSPRKGRVRVELLLDARTVEQQLVVAGCDPAVHLVAERLARHREPARVLGWPMGSTAALDALKRGEVHVAGLHVVDPISGESNLPFIRRHLRGDVTVVTFASWAAGLLVRKGNPKRIRGVSDLARKDVRIVNREEGAGARMLLDQRLRAEGIEPRRVRGYGDELLSHLDVGRRIFEGSADVGMGVEAVARVLGVDFLPIQVERYDLVMPTELVHHHRGLARLLDALVSQEVRAEIGALGGYDLRETGKVQDLAPSVHTRRDQRGG